MATKFRAAVIGSGNIGIDVLYKLKRSNILNPVLFIGRNVNSIGIQIAEKLGITTSIEAELALEKFVNQYDVIFDATSAFGHQKNAEILKKLNKLVIDLTPANIGEMCVPSINIANLKEKMNVNMVTCGGQASIPIVHAISSIHNNINYVEVITSIASKGAGLATRENIDEYIQTTERALVKFCQAKDAKVILNINPAEPCVNMKTTIFIEIGDPNILEINKEVKKIIGSIQHYIPGYKLIVEPRFNGERIVCTIEVTGCGDYLPKYSGNLDIITATAVKTAEYLIKYQMKD